jgi:hypothetical protein
MVSRLTGENHIPMKDFMPVSVASAWQSSHGQLWQVPKEKKAFHNHQARLEQVSYVIAFA